MQSTHTLSQAELNARLEERFPKVSSNTLRILATALWFELERLNQRNANVEVTR
jgi:hypothetical protein